MKVVLVVIVASLFSNVIFSQKSKALSVGDLCPDFVFRQMMNYPSSQMRLSDLKDKLLIIDIGGVRCPSCIEGAIEFSTSFKEKFKDSVFVLWLVVDTKEETIDYLKNNKNGRLLTLPMDIEYRKFADYFPGEIWPRQIWIKNRKIVAITNPAEVTYDHIRKGIMGIPVGLPQIRYDFDSFKYGLASFNNSGYDFVRNPVELYYNCVSKYIPNLNFNTVAPVQYNEFFRSRGGTRKTSYNQSILELYMDFLTNRGLNKWIEEDNLRLEVMNRYILEVVDPGKYDGLRFRQGGFQGNYNAWSTKNAYCFDAKFPVGTSVEDVRDAGVKCLDQFFGVKGRIEVREVNCWVISGSIDPMLAADISKIPNGRDSMIYSVYNKIPGNPTMYGTIGNLVDEIRLVPAHPPTIDETYSSQSKDAKLYVKITAESINNLDQLNKELGVYGLNVRVEKRKMSMLVITENGFTNK